MARKDMQSKRKKRCLAAGVAAAALGTAYLGLSAAAKAQRKRQEQEYGSAQEQQEKCAAPKHVSAYDATWKRIADKTLSFCGLLALAPVYAVISAAVYLDDPGPVLFTQKRVGKNKAYFPLHKFRSMKMDTPHDMPTHLLQDPEQYLTRVGRFLRKYSLDELPQIWDIFVGNMSIIGPRPALWNQEDLIAARDAYGANDIRPGLTGWAQINGRDELEIAEKARYDGEYVQKESFFFDVKCFFGTIASVLKHEGVVEGGTGNNQQRKKIVILTNHSYMLWRFRRELIEDLAKEHEVVLGMPFVGHEQDFMALGMRCVNIDVDRRGINPATDTKLIHTYYQLLKQEKPNLVITYSIKPNIYAGLCCRALHIPFCANVQGLGTAFQKPRLAKAVTILYREAFRGVKTVFFENTANAQEFVNRKIVPQEKITVLHGAGVDVQAYSYQAYPENVCVHFLYLGRIMKEKGMDELLDACEQLHQEGYSFVLDLVGFFEDAYKQRINQLSAQGIVVFHGFQQEPRPFYADCDCVVMPSYHEGMSNVLLEAAATGRPVITSDIPGCREAVVDQKSGLLVPKGDAQALYQAMKHMLSIDRAQREQMGLAGRKWIKQQFSKEQVVRETKNALM